MDGFHLGMFFCAIIVLYSVFLKLQRADEMSMRQSHKTG